MNIVIGKFGKSILFNKNNWGPIGGDAAPSLTFINYAKKHPEHTFYMIGKSDISRFKRKFTNNIFFDDDSNSIPNNIIDVWETYDKLTPAYEWPYKFLKLKQIDCGIFFMGPTGRSNIPDFIYTVRNPDQKAKSLMMFENYVAPIIYYLNNSQIPFFILSEDPRYVPPAMKDLYNVERFALSQFNSVIKTERVKSFEENKTYITHDVVYYYSKIETLFLLNEHKPDLQHQPNRDIPFLMILHGNPERFNIIKQWFIDTKIPVQVFGQWKEYEKDYPDIFKNIPMKNLSKEISRTKYTLILGRKYSNFVTQKFWETIQLGIIPFIHNEYDSDRLLPVPDILRVSSPQQLLEKITFLNNNENEYRNLLKHFDSVLLDEYYNGTYIENLLTSSIKKLYE